MGCDIHIHQEIQIAGSKWHHYAYRRPDRDYSLFWLIAGVRGPGDDEPIAPNRGIPSDVTTLTAIDYRYKNGDAHSATWLNAKEIADVEQWLNAKYKYPLNDYFGYLFGSLWSSFVDYPDTRGIVERKITDIRFIIWFDN